MGLPVPGNQAGQGLRQQARATIDQLFRTLNYAVNHPPENDITIYNVPDINAF
jgi:hypothetical protein